MPPIVSDVSPAAHHGDPSIEPTLPIADAANSVTTTVAYPSSASETGANSETGASQENHVIEPVPTPSIERGATSAATHTYNLWDRSTIGDRVTFNDEIINPVSSKSYSSQHLQFFQQDINDMHSDSEHFDKHVQTLYGRIVEYVFNQMTAKAGIRKHGEKAVMALFEEFAQLHDKSVFRAIKASGLISEQKRDALRAIDLIKEKRDGRLKGRTCADGREKRGWCVERRSDVSNHIQRFPHGLIDHIHSGREKDCNVGRCWCVPPGGTRRFCFGEIRW